LDVGRPDADGEVFFSNVVLATEVGIPIKVLDYKHFLHVSIPEVLAEYVRERCK
jgi:hypothetical protein